MRFAHISDTHLGQTQYVQASRMEDRNAREEDMYAALNEAIDISIRDRVDFAVLAGDLFDKPVPGGRAIVSLGDSLKRLKDAGIEAYFVLGEHDISRVRATPVAYVYHNLEAGRYIGDGRPVRHGEALLVGFDKMRRDEMPEHAEALRAADAAARGHAGKSVLVMHQGVIEANKFAGEIAASELPPSFSYYAMGHLHNRYEGTFDRLAGPVAYPGSTEVTAVEGIRGAKKGFYEVDISGEGASMEWVQLDTRPHLAFEAEYGELDSRVGEIAAEIGALKKRPVVRLSVSGPRVDLAGVEERTARIRDAALWLQVEAKRTEDGEDEGGEILSERPEHVDAERERLVKKALGDGHLSDLALNSLLPLLSAGRMEEALRVVLDDYDRFRRERQK